MPRKKLANQEERLSHNIIIRVPEKLLKKLDKLRQESRSPSIADVCRKILTNQKNKDISARHYPEPCNGRIGLDQKGTQKHWCQH